LVFGIVLGESQFTGVTESGNSPPSDQSHGQKSLNLCVNLLDFCVILWAT